MSRFAMRNQRGAPLIVLAILLTLFGSYIYFDVPRPSTAGLRLEIRSAGGDHVPADGVDIVAVVYNDRPEPVTLVAPGDGCYECWRTPLARASISRVGEVLPWKRRPDLFSPPFRRSCGNVNEIGHGDVFTLAPGESKQVGLWIPIVLSEPGTYRVTVHYVNHPEMRVPPGDLQPRDPSVLTRLAASLPCELHSNQLTINVTPAPGQ
jgi:hypothetical protein